VAASREEARLGQTSAGEGYEVVGRGF